MKTKERCTAHGGNPFLMEILAPGSCFWALSAGTNPKRRYGNNPIHRPDGFESSQNDAPLNLVMEGLAKVVSHWPRDENGARSSDGGSNILGDCDRDCGNSVLFNLPLNQSDRLMTNGSGRREQGKVGSLFLIDCAGNALGDRSLEPLKIEVLVLPVDALVSRRLQGLLSNHACEFEFPCVPGAMWKDHWTKGESERVATTVGGREREAANRSGVSWVCNFSRWAESNQYALRKARLEG